MSREGVKQENQAIDDDHMLVDYENDDSQPSLENDDSQPSHPSKGPASNELNENQREAARRYRRNEVEKLRYRNMPREKKIYYHKMTNERRRLKMENDPIFRRKILDQASQRRKLNMAENERILAIPNDKATPEELAIKEKVEAQKAKYADYLKSRKHKRREKRKLNYSEIPNSDATDDATHENMETGPSSSATSIKEKKAQYSAKYWEERKRILSIPTDQATPEELAKKDKIEAQNKNRAAYAKLRLKKVKEERKRGELGELTSNGTEAATNDKMRKSFLLTKSLDDWFSS